MSFLVKFVDEDEVWLPYSKDLCETQQFMQFCEKWSPLLPLCFSVREWKEFCKREDSRPITILTPGMKCYVDVRAWGVEWFISLDLPDWKTMIYVVECRVIRFDNRSKTKIVMTSKIFNQTFTWKNSDVLRYGNYLHLVIGMTLIDDAFIKRFPQLSGKN